MTTPPHRPGQRQQRRHHDDQAVHQVIQANRKRQRDAIAAVVAGASKPMHGLLVQALVETADGATDEGRLVEVVALPWFEIMERIQSNPNFIQKFAKHPRRFEEFLAACYKQAGYQDVVLTPPSGDFGIDVIICAELPGVGTVRFVDQAKAYSPGNLVTAADVRALLGVLARDDNISKGIITTTSSFAPGIEEEFKDFIPTRLELKDGPRLLGWLEALSAPR